MDQEEEENSSFRSVNLFEALTDVEEIFEKTENKPFTESRKNIGVVKTKNTTRFFDVCLRPWLILYKMLDKYWLKEIFVFLTGVDLHVIRRVCTTWKSIIDNDQQIWHSLLLKELDWIPKSERPKHRRKCTCHTLLLTALQHTKLQWIK